MSNNLESRRPAGRGTSEGVGDPAAPSRVAYSPQGIRAAAQRGVMLLASMALITSCAEPDSAPTLPTPEPASLAFESGQYSFDAPIDTELGLELSGATWDQVVLAEGAIDGQRIAIETSVPFAASTPGTHRATATVALDDGRSLEAHASIDVVEPSAPAGGFRGVIDVWDDTVALTADESGRVYLARNDYERLRVSRLTPEGDVDTSWAADGTYVGPSWADTQSWSVAAMHTLPDGALLVAGYWGYGITKDVFLVRLDASGTPDADFGEWGIVRHSASGNVYVEGATVLEDETT